MRWTIPAAMAGAMLLGGCASPGAPAETSAPAEPTIESSAPATPSATPTAEATPSATPTGEASATRITDESVLGQLDLVELGPDPVVVWAEPYSAVHVFGTGSGSEACQPTGEVAAVAGEALEIEFTPPDGMMTCTADLRVFGWEFTLPAEGSEAITTAVVSGWAEGEDAVTVEIRPAMGTS